MGGERGERGLRGWGSLKVHCLRWRRGDLLWGRGGGDAGGLLREEDQEGCVI